MRSVSNCQRVCSHANVVLSVSMLLVIIFFQLSVQLRASIFMSRYRHYVNRVRSRNFISQTANYLKPYLLEIGSE